MVNFRALLTLLWFVDVITHSVTVYRFAIGVILSQQSKGLCEKKCQYRKIGLCYAHDGSFQFRFIEGPWNE
jgi:hypothetical protein